MLQGSELARVRRGPVCRPDSSTVPGSPILGVELRPDIVRGDGWLLYAGRFDRSVPSHCELGVPGLFIVYAGSSRDGRVRRVFVAEDLRLLPSDVGQAGLCIAVRRTRIASLSIERFVELEITPLIGMTRAAFESLANDATRAEVGRSAGVDDFVMDTVQVLVREAKRAERSDMVLASRLVTLIDARHRDPDLDVSQVARELLTSRRQLYRVAAGGGVAMMIARRRVETARDLLVRRPELTIAEVALRSGFSGPSRLRAMLLRETGMTPRDYRRRATR